MMLLAFAEWLGVVTVALVLVMSGFAMGRLSK